MATYYKLYGLLFVFLNCFKPSYMLESPEIIFVDEPKTDKSCYVPNEKGILTTEVYITADHASIPYGRYIIAWSSNPNEDGTTWLIYDFTCMTFQLQDPTRWETTVGYGDNFIEYKLVVKDMIFQDETAGLYAFVIDRRTGLIVAKSSAKARFNVNHDCPLPIPTNDIPLTKETDPDSSASSTPTSSSSPSPSVGSYLSQKWSILTSHMEEITSCLTTGEFLVATSSLLCTIISIAYHLFKVIKKVIKLVCPDVYDYTREWFRRLWRRVLQQYREHGARRVDHALINYVLTFKILIVFLLSFLISDTFVKAVMDPCTRVTPIDIVIFFLFCLSRGLSFTDYILSLSPLKYVTLFFLYMCSIHCLGGVPDLSLTGYQFTCIVNDFVFLFMYLLFIRVELNYR